MKNIFWQSLRSGTLGSLAMMPFGLCFRLLDLRIGHYGKRVVEALFGALPSPLMQIVVITEHFVIGWISALPLVWLLPWWQRKTTLAPLWLGLAYGVGYYVVLNAWLLPRVFGDALPWSLGWLTVMPSLLVHVVFGLVVIWTIQPASLATNSR